MESIAFIGLGVMGKPMAGHLLNAGHPLTVHNRSQAAVRELAGLGARAASSPAECAAGADVVITMLPDGPDVELVLAGPHGAFEGSKPGALLVDMSTISPVTAKRLAGEAQQLGLSMLDAPVSGGEAGAINAQLSIMVGGDRAAFDRALPILQRLGAKITLMGEAGAGQMTKACNQLMVAIHYEAMAEALALGRKSGVDLQLLHAALSGGLANSAVWERRVPDAIKGNFQPGFRIRLHHKDLSIALDAAREFGVALPFTAQVRELYRAMMNNGEGELDHSAIVLLLERLAGMGAKPL
ncbi:MAG: 2-hydroxy-3-oxopropionate reductase [Chloroflexota bacterium]|nr:2-hydroxy-3-oxopropionate reductase [Chloroflexota bacterium]